MNGSTTDPGAPEIWTTRWLETRASLALKALAVLNVLALALNAAPGTHLSSSLSTAMWGLGTGAAAVVYVVEALALDRRSRWAVAAVRPMLILFIASGAYSTAVMLGGGPVRVPLEALFAIWALFASADVRPTPPVDLRGAGLLGAVAALLAVVLFAGPVFGWGGLIDVREPDLDASLDVDCGPAGAGPPATITLTYDWSWSRTSPFPSGLDVLVITWTGDDALGRPLYLLGETPAGVGITPGLQDQPSLAMARQVEEAARASWHWGIQLTDQQLAPGHIEATLTITRPNPPEPRPLTLIATYIHVGVWQQESAPVTCSW